MQKAQQRLEAGKVPREGKQSEGCVAVTKQDVWFAYLLKMTP